jgi:hypothetical protein
MAALKVSLGGFSDRPQKLSIGILGWNYLLSSKLFNYSLLSLHQPAAISSKAATAIDSKASSNIFKSCSSNICKS